ncbi:molybdenum ABC transporter ATP-binding protein [Bacterioplanes sanyensis]|uniref:Molybdenum ABC transporter ATP-binding protein n=1 Tax=Bacterioplanes sanyensis TaxID=1249553 RepID=A0A222FE07_9GAMM|nr:molybdenum ABC transporter ATP-binding protein [Bacterioplanes sanyensis]ASP37325.1 molybdenum ABC transporter ATP-binding protein [Bacterioplanes sanyensis]
MSSAHTVQFDLELQRGSFRLQAKADIHASGITAVYGPSGCGKTTLLRCLAGLERAQGTIKVGEQYWQQHQQFTPVHQRSLGYVFQEASLLPHLSVADNLNYARKRAAAPMPATEIQHLLSEFGIEQLMHTNASALSGGERQRVALVRALLIRPQLLLLDEPLAALDHARRQRILPYLQRLPHWFNGPIVYVSHSLDEISRLADQVLVMEQGRTQAPCSVADALGHLQQLPDTGEALGTLISGHCIAHQQGLDCIDIGPTSLWIQAGTSPAAIGQKLQLRLLASDISLSLAEIQHSSALNQLPVRIEQLSEHNASQMRLTLRLLQPTGSASDVALLALITQRSCQQLQLTSGQTVWAQLKASAVNREI